nr:MAG TPA: hypothetical protein [Bacteriophage sp.]
MNNLRHFYLNNLNDLKHFLKWQQICHPARRRRRGSLKRKPFQCP